jgi:hypothetical protein
MAAAEYKLLLREYYGFCIFASVTGTRYDELKGHLIPLELIVTSL